MTEHEPLYSCRHEGCREEVSYPADMLRQHPDGGLVCQDCWEYDPDGHEERWLDLPRFVSDKDEAESLRAQLAEARLIINGGPASGKAMLEECIALRERATAAEAALEKAERERDDLAAQAQEFLVWLTALFPAKTVYIGSEHKQYQATWKTEQADRFEADWTNLCQRVSALKQEQENDGR